MSRLISSLAGSVSGAHVLAVLAAGAVVRLALLRQPLLWYDEATVGVMGLAVLRGELPIYFFGQPFMGALDAYLAAPLYVALGVSARTLELLAVLIALAWMALVVRLAWDAFGPRAALWTAVGLTVPPDYLLRWTHEGRPHYTLPMALGTLALLLALRAPVAAPGRALLHFGLLGGVLGLAFWTNFLSLVFFPPVAVLVVRRLRPHTLVSALAGVAGFLIGSLPHWLYGLSHGTALPPAGGRIRGTDLVTHLQHLWHGAWPILAGVPEGLRGAAAGTLLSLALAVGYALACAVAVRALRRDAPAARATRLALLVLVAANLGAAVGTRYGRFLLEDARYLIPLYTALPVLLGHGLASLGSWRWAAGLAGTVLLVHGAGAATGEIRSLVPPVAIDADARAAAERETIAALERDGPHRLYTPDFTTRVLTFLSAERVIFSNPYEESYPPHARAVDGAEAVGWWFAHPFEAFEATLRALGVGFTFRPAGPLGGVYADFTLASPPLRELDPSAFTVTASEEARAAGWMVDRDIGTQWRTARPARGGEWIEVDLGRIEPVALVRWLPGKYQEVPRGLTLEASLDGRAWQRLIDVPSYFGPLYWSAGRPMGRVRNGRVELRVPPTPARYLRIAQTGRDPIWQWAIRELFVYAPADGSASPPSAGDGTALAHALRRTGVRRLYADHGWGSRAAVAEPAIRILPANLAVDAYGFAGPAAAFLQPFRWTPGDGVLLEPVDAEAFARAAHRGGLGFTRQPLGGLVLFTYAPPTPRPGTPLTSAALRATASRQPDQATLAVDGDHGTRWATARPQTPGDWFRIDLATDRPVRAIRLWTAYPTDTPRGLTLEGSEDGTAWREIAAEVRTEGRHSWGGIALLRDGVDAVRLDFAPVALRALRLTLTRGAGAFDWSIHELTVYTD